MEITIGCVGKPSVGKSTFFNAVTDGKAKVGNYPFTTIEPNQGVSFFRTPCPCVAHGKTAECRPKYGKCENGTRYIPVKLLDVAGLVPGASEGAGLGNKFLDDLRHADVLLHILDASGTTNEKGEETVGYDPVNDAQWLDGEIHAWIFNNLWKRWPQIARRHAATRSSAAPTLLNQMSGYGANPALVNKLLDEMKVRDPVDFQDWGEERVHELVDAFLKVRFPTILLLNKADQGGETDKNIARIVERYDAARCFVASAGAECFLKMCRAKKLIRYQSGEGNFMSIEDVKDDVDFRKMRGEEVSEAEADVSDMVELDQKSKKRLEKVRDMVLFRYGSTGVWAAVQAAVEKHDPVVVFPVRSLTNFAAEADGSGIFGSAMLVAPGTPVKQVVHMINHQMVDLFQYAELLEEGNTRRRVGEDYVFTGRSNIVKFFFRPVEEHPSSGQSQPRAKPQTKVDKKGDGDEAGGGGP